ncbi:MAG: hypothetical protein U1B83_04825, partial [Candidatus Cloacimonadaceae bacterium]|nr:hypothetical protein [Candidatus Cloacimonadaceae bacterium]
SMCDYKVSKSEKDGKHWYMQISLSREALLRHYAILLQNKIDEALVLHAGLNNLIEQKQTREALALSKKLRGLLDDLYREATILGSLLNASPEQILTELIRVPRVGEMDFTIVILSGNPVQEYSDLANEAISMLDKEFQAPLSYARTPFEWGDTGFASDFSDSFGLYLATELENRFGWKKALRQELPRLSFGGRLIPEGERFMLILNFSSGERRQSLPLYISAATIERFGRDSFVPKDLEIKQIERRELAEQSVLGKSLQVSVKSLEYGRDPAVFRYDEQANILIRANRACYVSLVYIEANGDRNLLTQNYFIAPDMANQWIPLPDEFVFCPPSGIEQLWLQADVVKLPEYETQKLYVSDNAFKNIVIGLSETLALTRGIKIKEAMSSYTEDYLSWTVMER